MCREPGIFTKADRLISNMSQTQAMWPPVVYFGNKQCAVSELRTNLAKYQGLVITGEARLAAKRFLTR